MDFYQAEKYNNARRNKIKTIIIAGAGASGIYSAYLLRKSNCKIMLIDKKPYPGTKLKLAGKSGFNISNSCSDKDFHLNYGKNSDFFKQIFIKSPPSEFIKEMKNNGIQFKEGSSGKFFPTDLSASDFIQLMINKAAENPEFTFTPDTELINIAIDKKTVSMKNIRSGTSENVEFDYLITGFGGASWPETGSDGKWTDIFSKYTIQTNNFKPVNCGFKAELSQFFFNKYSNTPLKNITLHFGNQKSSQELMITNDGIQGGAVYTLSYCIREQIELSGSALSKIDLLPDLTHEQIFSKLNKSSSKNTLSNRYRKALNLKGAKFALLNEPSFREKLKDFQKAAALIKNYPIILTSPYEIKRAISVSGGIDIKEVDSNLQLKRLPSVFCAGEMLDWEAPTGGYLLQGCFSTASVICKKILADIHN